MRRRVAAGVTLLALVACQREVPRAATPDIGNAASKAQADIEGYAAATGNAVPPTAPTRPEIVRDPPAQTPVVR